jgi:hypothetical protein
MELQNNGGGLKRILLVENDDHSSSGIVTALFGRVVHHYSQTVHSQSRSQAACRIRKALLLGFKRLGTRPISCKHQCIMYDTASIVQTPQYHLK